MATDVSSPAVPGDHQLSLSQDRHPVHNTDLDPQPLGMSLRSSPSSDSITCLLLGCSASCLCFPATLLLPFRLRRYCCLRCLLSRCTRWSRQRQCCAQAPPSVHDTTKLCTARPVKISLGYWESQYRPRPAQHRMLVSVLFLILTAPTLRTTVTQRLTSV